MNDDDDNDNDISFRKAFIRCWSHAHPEKAERASALYDLLSRKWPQVTRGGHRGLVGRMKPWHRCGHRCPYCGKEAVGLEEIDKKFGFRFYTARDTLYLQSWCRECRSKGVKKPVSDPRFNVRVNPTNDDCIIWTN